MDEVSIKSHLIITDIHERYDIKWCGKLINTKPMFKNNLPIFVIISGEKRVELNTLNIQEIEECAKRITNPRGRAAVTLDTANIYLKEEDGNEAFMGTVKHYRVKNYAPMFDKVGFR